MAIERIPDPTPRRNFIPAGAGARPNPPRLGVLTGVLIAICGVVAYLSKLGDDHDVVGALLITNEGVRFGELALPEIARGEVWRLVTPIFLHFGIVHLIFNLLWLKDLGTAIEKLCGGRVLLGLVLVSGALSNLGQFVFAGPVFGGMSGVVYALLGFVWMKSKFDPGAGFYLDKQTVLMMLGWFVLCAVGVIPHVANYAHGFGLVIGMVWGMVSAKSSGRRGYARF